MKPKTQIILINASIAAGLLLMFYRGSGALPVLITGALLFTIANVLLALKQKRSKRF